jgi:hypothetical protein
MPDRRETYREEAARCFEAANQSKDQNSRAELVRLAAKFLELAGQPRIDFDAYNPTSVRYDKQYVVLNSCAPTTFRLKPGERASFLASRADTSTILFRGSERKGLGRGWRSNAVFSERVFWTLFGGKEVDFEWQESY